ncbi:MAG: sulfite exporter TauE/SafE family protein [Thermoanaerobacterales bacterium]|nr:sulfite exporter TauE/SafE family protein [Bacillota bacterium]MDI6906179.1 sulfite exporter TauE/SafE family protein [Thermoanaerobacterales bacterium]
MLYDQAWFVSCLVVFVAAALQSVTGFGFALIAVPLFLLVYDPRTAITVTMVVSFTTLLLLTIRVRAAVVRPLVANLFLGSLAGIPFGVYGFLHFDVTLLKILICGVTIPFSLALATRLRLYLISGTWTERLIGSVSGFLAGSISLPGPPVILFLNCRHLPKERFRATTAAYFTAVYPVGLLLLVSSGAIPLATIRLSLTLIPFALIGSAAGARLFPFVPQAHFQRGVPLLVLATAAYTLAAALSETEAAMGLPF